MDASERAGRHAGRAADRGPCTDLSRVRSHFTLPL